MYVEVPAWRLCFLKNSKKGVRSDEFAKRGMFWRVGWGFCCVKGCQKMVKSIFGGEDDVV